MPYFEVAYEMEPNNLSAKNMLTRALYYSGQYERLFRMGLDEFRVYGMLNLGRLDGALQLATEMASNGQQLTLIQVLAARGEYAELIQYVESHWSNLEAFEADYPERDGWSERNYLGMIAYAYRRMGDEEMSAKAMRRFAAALEYQRQMGANNPNFAFAEAVYAVLDGDHGTALTKLARAFEVGVSFDPNLSNSWPMFAALDGDAEYEAILRRKIDHLNSERSKMGLGPIGEQSEP
jgi:hypothetical protein